MMNLKRLQGVIDSLKAAVSELELLASETYDTKADNKTTKPTAKKEKTAEVKSKDPTPAEDLPWEKKTLTFEEVRRLLAQKSKSGYSKEIKALITKHGAEKLSDIKPSEYAALLAEAEVLGR